jgi:hypothetical protein
VLSPFRRRRTLDCIGKVVLSPLRRSRICN